MDNRNRSCRYPLRRYLRIRSLRPLLPSLDSPLDSSAQIHSVAGQKRPFNDSDTCQGDDNATIDNAVDEGLDGDTDLFNDDVSEPELGCDAVSPSNNSGLLVAAEVPAITTDSPVISSVSPPSFQIGSIDRTILGRYSVLQFRQLLKETKSKNLLEGLSFPDKMTSQCWHHFRFPPGISSALEIKSFICLDCFKAVKVAPRNGMPYIPSNLSKHLARFCKTPSEEVKKKFRLNLNPVPILVRFSFSLLFDLFFFSRILISFRSSPNS